MPIRSLRAASGARGFGGRFRSAASFKQDRRVGFPLGYEGIVEKSGGLRTIDGCYFRAKRQAEGAAQLLSWQYDAAPADSARIRARAGPVGDSAAAGTFAASAFSRKRWR